MKRKSGTVEIEDIKRVYRLFVDVKRSTQYLMEYNKEFMFNELDDRTTEYGDGEAAITGVGAVGGGEEDVMSSSP
jgi:RuvB-like protein 2